MTRALCTVLTILALLSSSASACELGRVKGLTTLAKELKIKAASNPQNAIVMTDCDGKQYDMVELMTAAVRAMKPKDAKP